MEHRHHHRRAVETEVKLAVGTAREARALLERAGFAAVHERAFEANTVWDRPGGELMKTRRLLRLRSFRGEAIVTFKGPPEEGRHKTRPEYETTAADAGEMERILEGLGYVVTFRYEKYRTTYGRAGEAGLAVLDETPIGVYLELEGEGAWIDRTAAEMGFGEGDYITLSYGSLWREHCERAGVEGEMVFGG